MNDHRITKVPAWYWIRIKSLREDEWTPHYIVHEDHYLYEPYSMSLEESMWDHFDVVGPIKMPTDDCIRGYDGAETLLDNDQVLAHDNHLLLDLIEDKLWEIFWGYPDTDQRAVFARTVLVHLRKNMSQS